MRTTHLIAGLAAALLLGACGGDGTTDPGTGGGGGGDGGNGSGGGTGSTSYSATVTGDITATLSGSAYYGDGEDGTTSGGFGVAMGVLDTQPKAWFVVGRGDAGVPAVGTYPLADATGGSDVASDEFVAGAQFNYADAEDQVCSSSGGELKITSAGGERVKGTFTATMTCVGILHQIDGPTQTINVSGQFDSRKAVIPY